MLLSGVVPKPHRIVPNYNILHKEGNPKVVHRLQMYFLTVILTALLLLNPIHATGFASAQSPVEFELSAQAAVLIEAGTGQVLYAKNAEETMYPASLTKIMTLLLAMEEKERGGMDWDTVITASERAWKTGGSTMFLDAGQQTTFREMLRGIAIVSANDACVAVAEYLYGSETVFAQKMNQRATELGLTNTHYMNSHGLHHPDHVTTALDMAKLTAFFIRTQPEAAAFQAEREFTFNGIRQFNRNPLLGTFPGADGTKTGNTPEAGSCLVATAVQNGMRLITVVLNCASDSIRGQDCEILLNHGFRNYELATAVEEGQLFASANVTRGTVREVKLVAAGPVKAMLPRGEADKLQFTVQSPETLTAPFEEGKTIGAVTVTLAGETVGEVELVTAGPVEKLGFFHSVWRNFTDLLASLWGKVKPGK